MVKKLNGYFLTKKVIHKLLIKVHQFSGSKVRLGSKVKGLSCKTNHT